MFQSDQEVIILDDEPPKPAARPPPASHLPCYVCRKAEANAQAAVCKQCGRSYHVKCLLSKGDLCGECAGLCGKCALVQGEAVKCPKCGLSYHGNCEPLVKELTPTQVCSQCISEVLTPETIEARYPSKSVQGQNYAVIKVKALPCTHLICVPETQVQATPLSREPAPAFQYEDVLKWKDCYGQRMGYVKFLARPYADNSWEYDWVITALKRDSLALEGWFCSEVIRYIAPPPPRPAIKTTVEKAQELLLAFGYDQNDGPSEVHRAYCQLRLGDFGVDLGELSQELPSLAASACQHFSNGAEMPYKGATLKVRELFFRNIEIMLLRAWLKQLQLLQKSAISTSETYKSSFSDFQAWSAKDDIALLQAVAAQGFGRWHSVLQSLSKTQDLGDLSRAVFGEATDPARLELFVEQRTRFLVYCLMEEEYLFCESR